ncbi:MAG TPA: hypothetical protein VEC14_10570, partial [Reyranellaceae bacterium]|nr:hypothetical protein [Reyranellaceae bacterium]
ASRPAMKGESMAKAHKRTRLSRWTTKLVNAAFTTFRPRRAGAARRGLPWPYRMANKSPKAGGFLWMAAIMIGAAAGIATGQPMLGVLAGTAAGAAIAIAVWLADRRRG